MAMAMKIRILMIERDVKIKDLAKHLKCTSSNISAKLKRDNFCEEDLQKIADFMNCDFEGAFVLRDNGKKI